MSTEPLVIVKREHGVISIYLNRPDKKNALTGAMYTAISDALDELDNQDALRVGFISGTPDCFTAGNDLQDFMENPPQGEDTPVFRFLNKIATLQKPLIAAVNGHAVGVGTTLLLHCELVYAAPNAKFQMPFVNLGLCPEAGSSLLLPQIVGYQRAAQLLMFGDSFSAEEAHQWGMVNEVFYNEDYQAKAYDMALKLARQPAKSLRITKQLLRKANAATLKDIMAVEGENFTAMLTGAEAREAMSAFMEKRKPDFSQFN
jgi:enoyl-CoA hydratase/carnithine racemase